MKKILALCVISLFSFTFSGCFTKYYTEKYDEGDNVVVIIEEPSYPDPPEYNYSPYGGTTPTTLHLGKGYTTKTKDRTNTQTKPRNPNSGSSQSNSDRNSGYSKSGGNTTTQARNNNGSRQSGNDNLNRGSRNSNISDNNKKKPATQSSGTGRR